MIWVGFGTNTNRYRDRARIRERNINIRLVRGRTPLNTAMHSTFADAYLPKNLAIPVGIDSVNNS